MATPLRELFVRLGLEKDEASFAEAFATVEILKKGLETVSEFAKEGVKWLGEQVKATAEAGEEAKHLAQQTGFSVAAVQKYTQAAQLAGVSSENLVIGLRHLARTGVRDLQAGLLQTAEQFSKMADGGTKSALAQEKFGRSGATLIPFLNRGREGVKELLDQVDDLGAVMSAEGVKDSEEYAESQKRLGLAFVGLRNSVLVPMLKTFTALTAALVRVVLGFRQWYSQAKNLVPILKFVAIALLSVGAALTIQAAATWLSTTSLAALAAGFVTAAAAAWEATIAFLAAAAPIAAIAAVIALVILTIEDFYTFVNGGDSLIGRALHKWLGPFKDWHEALQLVWQKVQEGFKAGLAVIGQYFVSLWDQVKYLAVEAWDAILDYIKSIGSQIADWFKGQIKEILSVIPGGGKIAAGLFGGGAASPGAAAVGAASAVSNSSSISKNSRFSATFNVTAAPGSNPEETAKHVRDTLEDWHNAKMAEAAAATG